MSVDKAAFLQAAVPILSVTDLSEALDCLNGFSGFTLGGNGESLPIG